MFEELDGIGLKTILGPFSQFHIIEEGNFAESGLKGTEKVVIRPADAGESLAQDKI